MSLYLLNRSFKKKATFSNGKSFKKSHFILIKYLSQKGSDEKNGIITNIFPSIPTMAENTFLAESTIYECLRDFKEEGMLVKIGKTKFRTVNYVMHTPKLEVILVPLEESKHKENQKQEVHPSGNRRDIPPEIGPNPLDNPLFSSTKVENKIEDEESDQVEELHLISNKMADKEHISNCINKFGLSVSQLMTAISLCNTLGLNLENYNKYFKVATCKIKEGESESRIKYIIQERINAIANKKPFRTQNQNDPQRIEMSIADIVANGLNYNRYFKDPYVIHSKYESARSALIAAGVNFEIR